MALESGYYCKYCGRYVEIIIDGILDPSRHCSCKQGRLVRNEEDKTWSDIKDEIILKLAGV